jgi:uncharacterized membrane protein
MASRASIAKHPIHPMLVAFPIGLWVFSLTGDIIYITGWGGVVWKDVAFYTMAGGIVGALVAAVPGFIDLLSLSGKRLKIGIAHMVINLSIVAIFAVNLWIRTKNIPNATLPVALSVIGVILLIVSGWLGGELIYVYGVAVEPQYDSGTEGRTK